MKRMMFVGAIALIGLAPAKAPRAQGREGGSGGAVNEVSAGTRFLVGLEETLSTGNLKAGDHFRVRTLDGVVYLSGQVMTPLQQSEAEDLARQAAGVKRVVSTIAVSYRG